MVVKSSDLLYTYKESTISLHISCQGKELDVTVPTIAAVNSHVTDFISFCGAFIHKPSHLVQINAYLVYS